MLGRALSDRKLWRPALDTLAAFARHAGKSPTSAANTKSCATITVSGCWITPSNSDSASPRACFQFSEDLAKRTDFSPFLALGGERQAGAVFGRKAALRRGPQARRALQHQSARRPAVDGEGKPAEIGRIQHLRARPQAVRALHRAGLCAAAHRPARHSAGQRQYAVGVGAGVPDRRPQPDQHRDRQRLPEGALQLPARRPRQRARRKSLVRRARHRDHAQSGRHHRIPGRFWRSATCSPASM